MILHDGSSSIGDFVVVAVAIIGGGVTYVEHRWKFFAQHWKGSRGRDWTAVNAIIDVVSVTVQTEQSRYGERTIGYQATLTYFYRNPELQMGEYYRMFNTKGEADAWTASLKGINVKVRVDPRDPSRSVLRQEELDAVTPVAALRC